MRSGPIKEDTPAGRCRICRGRLKRTPSGVLYHVFPGADHEPEPEPGK